MSTTGNKKSNGHYLSAKEIRAIAKENAKVMRALEKKKYRDMTGNNVNHANDFTARVYAQTVFQTICGYEE